MPNLANAKKALRQSKKKADRNKVVFEEIQSLRRRFRKLLEAKKFDEAKLMTDLINKKSDKAVTKRVIKKNHASRIKARSMAMLNRLK